MATTTLPTIALFFPRVMHGLYVNVDKQTAKLVNFHEPGSERLAPSVREDTGENLTQ